MNSIKERESFVQSMFLLFLVMVKRYAGYLMGKYENVLFIFSTVLILYLVHLAFVKFSKEYPKRDDWEEKLNLWTMAFYGVGILFLQLMQVTNLLVMAAVGIILIAINVLIKSKRKAAKENMKHSD